MTVSSPSATHSVHEDRPSPEFTASTARRDDGSTRYLCAAVHRYPRFAQRVIADYLVETVRAIPPSPGLDLAAVLRDALAARCRQRARDALLLTLLVLLTVVAPVGVVLWAGVALFVRRWLAGRRPPGWLVAAVTPVLVVLLLGMLGTVRAFTGVGWPWGDRSWWPGVLLGALLLAVVAVDEIVVHRLVRTRLRAGEFSAHYRDASSSWERFVRGLGQRTFHDHLERVATADEYSRAAAGRADVVVHAGTSPFVGAGVLFPTQTIALALEPADAADDAPEPDRIDVAQLHHHVAAAMASLRSSSLVPGMRIEGILRREQVLVSADLLLKKRDTDLGATLLPSNSRPPLRHITLAEARALADLSHSWARYYNCYRVESADGQLVTSCYLYLGADHRMLSLKLTHCLLLPVASGYHGIDYLASPGSGPVSSTAVTMLALPITAWRRVRTVTRRLRPRRRGKGRRVYARHYGAGHSLRERVTEEKPSSEFLRTDAALYVKTVDTRVLNSIEQYLERCGYNVLEFRRSMRTTINENNINIKEGTFTNTNLSTGSDTINMVTGGKVEQSE